jgi:serine O-acetyltransferase
VVARRGWEQGSWGDLLEQVREDRRIYGPGGWSKPGFHAVAVHRLGVWIRGLPAWQRRALRPLYSAAHIFVRNVYSIELTSETKVGKRLYIGHQGGIVIHSKSVLGDDCIIRQNVTIGQVSHGPSDSWPVAPQIGNRVHIGAGAVIVGGILIGDDAVIGANAVVMTDVPAGGTAFAPPARLMKRPAEELE